MTPASSHPRLIPAVAAGLTLAALAPAQAAATEAALTKTAPAEHRAVATLVRPPVMPNAITSFGAARVGGWLYVYGGHIGRAHAHTRDNVLGTFQRLNLADGSSWQTLPAGPALQGTALVAAPDGRLYRIGGTDARNEPGADADMHSTASVARFDPVKGRWDEVTPLPEPRSSHDAIVHDNKLYVVGGWHLAGAGEGDWHDTAWVADLASEPLVWQALPAPGKHRRACAVATFGGRIAVLGGIDPDRTIATVQVFDPATDTWSDGPELPGFAFGTAALGVGDTLYATVLDGRVLAWDGQAESPWRVVSQLEMPRFFHRMIPLDDGLLAFGGAGRGGHMRTIESVRLEQPGPDTERATRKGPAIKEWVIPTPGEAAYRQALLLKDNVIYAFGGNRGRSGERFAPAQFADDIWRVELTTMSATLAGRLPAGRQSAAVANWGGRRENVILGGLGIANDEGSVQSLATGFRWDARRNRLIPFEATLPAPRTQFRIVSHDGILLALGGIDFRPDPTGGSTGADTKAVLTCDPASEEPTFAASGIELPRARRSFGAAILGSELILVGGLGDGFAHAGPCDVFDLETRTWRELEAPANWVSPQVATIGDRLYVACGGTMSGMKFTSDRSVWSYDRKAGWQRVVDELPFAVRHVQMLSNRNQLLFYSANEPARDRIVIRTLVPDPDERVLEAGFHR